MALVDTHCHLYFERFDQDRGAVLQRARQAGVEGIIVPAIDLESAEQALALARAHDGIFAAAGIHPNSSADFRPGDVAELRRMAEDPALVAIGEIGLDYHWDRSPKRQQIHALEAQLDLAAELELPVIIHNRESSDDLLDVLETWAPSTPASLRGRLGALHSFSASWPIARRAIDLGFYLGFTGPITYKQADELRRVASQAPVDRLLIETDAPFLAPQARRGKRNEPAWLPYINAKLAELRGMTADAMARQTTANAERLFRLER